MMDWLYRLPEPLILLLGAASMVLPVIYLPRLIRRVPVLALSEADTGFMIDLQTSLFTMTAFALAFTLV